MEAQIPAVGIMKIGDWGHSKMYRISCDCSNPDHDLTVEVEADDFGVNVNTFATIKTDYWSESIKVNNAIENDVLQDIEWTFKGFVNSFIRKVKLTWDIWARGYVQAETTITMSEQQAINFATTLRSAINDVKEFKEARFSKSNNKP